MPTFEQRLNNPRERIYLSEVLKEVGKILSKDDQVKLLRAYANRNSECLDLMKNFMQCTWHPAVDMDVPKPGAPEFKSDYPDYNLAPGTLKQAFAKVKYFVKGQSTYVENTIKREQIFIQILESLFMPEAKLFVMIKDKKIDKRVYPGVTEDLMREAFSGWLPPKEPSNPTEEQSK